MSWRVVAAVLTGIFIIAVVQAALAGPLLAFAGDLKDSGDYTGLSGNPDFDAEATIDGMVNNWFDMGLVGMFGLIAWAAARVLRRELTRGRQPP